jgi:hypothetical protein
MYIGRDLPNIEYGATRFLGYDLSATLAIGEIISSATSSMILLQGDDTPVRNNPQVHFSGNPSILGTDITQACVFLDPTGVLVGNVYALLISATTSFNQIIVPWARISIQAGYGFPPQLTNMPPGTARLTILPAPGPKFTLPTDGGYAGQDFPVADLGEARLYGFDLSPTLSPGEIIQIATFALLSEQDEDGVPTDSVVANNANAYFTGSPILSGGMAQQMISWPIAAPSITGNSYILSLIAQTSLNQAIETWSRIAIESLLSPPVWPTI